MNVNLECGRILKESNLLFCQREGRKHKIVSKTFDIRNSHLPTVLLNNTSRFQPNLIRESDRLLAGRLSLIPGGGCTVLVDTVARPRVLSVQLPTHWVKLGLFHGCRSTRLRKHI
jgi:hypothetical protein